jgi:hypothetical protein
MAGSGIPAGQAVPRDGSPGVDGEAGGACGRALASGWSHRASGRPRFEPQEPMHRV